MAEKDVTAVEEKDYEHHLTWRGWLSFIVIALSFSGVLKDMGPLSAFDFTVLTGKFGKIEGLSFIGKGGVGAAEGFMFALTLFPTVILALGFVRAPVFKTADGPARLCWFGVNQQLYHHRRWRGTYARPC